VKKAIGRRNGRGGLFSCGQTVAFPLSGQQLPFSDAQSLQLGRPFSQQPLQGDVSHVQLHLRTQNMLHVIDYSTTLRWKYCGPWKENEKLIKWKRLYHTMSVSTRSENGFSRWKKNDNIPLYAKKIAFALNLFIIRKVGIGELH
jgi:hypothetical protein